MSCTGLLAASPRIQFEPNHGQTDPRVHFLARTSQGIVFFTSNALVFSRAAQTPVTFEWRNANPDAPWEPLQSTGQTTSYQVGRDPSRWAQNVPEYEKLARRGLYPGIDAVYYANGRQLEYDLLVAPGADPARIRFRIRGAKRISLSPDGDLLIATPGGIIRQHTPSLYQSAADGTRAPVRGRFRLLSRNEVGFAAGPYDRTRPLAIDPTLESSTYLGGSGDDAVVFASGSISAGNTTSSDFPDGLVARRSGTDIFYRSGTSTQIIGGSGDDYLTGAALMTTSGAPVLFGYTNSRDLPTSPYSQQPNYGGGVTDGFFVYFNVQNYFSFAAVSYLGATGEARITAGVTYGGILALTGWTTTRTLSSVVMGTAPPLDGPGGGVDGFLATFNVFGSGNGIQQIYPGAARYFGGSGDDKPAAISAPYFNSFYYIAGETTSADFPGLTPASSARAGASDAFVIRYDKSYPSQDFTSVLLGGSGTDRATGVQALTNGTVVVAGTTTSTDLTLVHPNQAAYGGGASDAFVAQLTPDLSQVTAATYWGGSAAEEATSVAAGSSASEFFVGGWTASPDFPVTNALQPRYGGGPDDGFLVHYDPEGSVYQATFFGGSGSDHILNLTPGAAFEVSLGGQTTSPDFPLLNATQTGLLGGSDGFVSMIGAQLVDAPHVTGSAGFRAYAHLTVPVASPPTVFTLTTSNPSAVLLASVITDTASASITTAAPWTANLPYYYVDCQANGVSADISITAPGFPSKTSHVDCVVPTLSGGSSTLNTGLWSRPSTIFFALYAVNPNNPRDSNYLYAPNPVTVQVQNSNPSAATTSAPTISVGGSPTATLIVTPAGLGSTDLTFSAPALVTNASIHVAVLAPYTVYNPAPIPGGFEASYGIGLSGTPPPGVTVTYTSGDPARLLIAANGSNPGSASLSTTNLVYLQALDTSGSVPLNITVTGFPAFSVSVPLTAPVLAVSGNLVTAPSLKIGQQSSLTLRFVYGFPNPGTAPAVTVQSSDPSVLLVPTTSSVLGPGLPAASFQVRALKAGTATLTFGSSIGATVATAPLIVTVTHQSLGLQNLELGKNLMTSMTLAWPPELPVTENVTITTSNPNLVLLSTSLSVPPQPRLTVNASKGLPTIYLTGLSDSGSAVITARPAGSPGVDPPRLQRSPGLGMSSATVTLVPSGIGWFNSSVSTNLYAATASASLVGFALDPVTRVPIAEQLFAPGVTASIAVQTDHPEIAAPPASPLVLPAPAGRSGIAVSVRNVGPGTATLTFTQPPGFTQPASRQQLQYRVLKQALQFSSSQLGINTQEKVLFLNVPAALKQSMVTLTSSDPTKLVLSADPTVRGSGTTQVAFGSPFYIQALDSRGTPGVTASLAGFADTTVEVPLQGTALVLSVSSGYFGGSTMTNGEAYTTLQSGATTVSTLLKLVNPDHPDSVSGYSNATLLPGINPAVTVQSSNPQVGTIQGSPVTLSGSTTSVTFQPVSPGDTTVSVAQLPGFTTPATGASLLFHVSQPGWQTLSLGTVGKDTLLQVTAPLASNVKPPGAAVSVTITSSDPTRLLLSPNTTVVPTSSIQLPLPANFIATPPFYVAALDHQGTVPVTVTAPGYASGTINVSLTDTYFGLSLASRVVLQGGPVKGTIIYGSMNSSGSATFRPGVSVTAHLQTSDPTVLAIDAPDVTVTPGVAAQFTVRPVAAGSATVTIVPPVGYLAGSNSTVNVTVDALKVNLGGTVTVLGKDLQASTQVTSELGFQTPPGTLFTVASGDPTRLLVSTSATAVGSAQVSIPGPSGNLYLQALADNGSVTVTASTPGAQTATATIQLVPSGAVFTSYSNPLSLAAGSTYAGVSVALVSLDPKTLAITSSFNTPRPGWTGSVSVTSSDPTVATATPSTVQFSGSSSQPLQIQARGDGSVYLSLGLLPGEPPPASGRSIPVSVRTPLAFGTTGIVQLGQNLQVSLGAGSGMASGQAFTVVSSDPTRLLISTSPTAAGTGQVTLTGASTIYLQALGNTGTVTLTAFAPGWQSAQIAVRLRSTTAVFCCDSSGTSLNLTANSFPYSALPELVTIDPTTGNPDFSLSSGTPRAGWSGTVTVTSSNPQVVSVTPATIQFPGSNQIIQIKPLAPGSAIISLGPLPGDTTSTLAHDVFVTVQ